MLRYLTIPLLLLALLACNSGPTIAQGFTLAEITRVIDGDTIDVRLNGNIQRVRLIGIDTPETVAPGQPVDCWGPEASAKAKELMEGQRVELETDPSQGDKDVFGRLLRYVWLDGTNVAEAMIESGDGEEYTYRTAYRHQKAFQEAEGRAQQAKAGIWGNCKLLGPQSGPGPEPDRDCSDFTSWRQAQDFYEAAGGPETDRHRLDGDGDGIACEGLR
ncbi:MAG: micrococcal nuclease [Chloroflexi bacterium]|nr:MAG: micrococcal nuclease [Chloroflexota bacterium]